MSFTPHRFYHGIESINSIQATFLGVFGPARRAKNISKQDLLVSMGGSENPAGDCILKAENTIRRFAKRQKMDVSFVGGNLRIVNPTKLLSKTRLLLGVGGLLTIEEAVKLGIPGVFVYPDEDEEKAHNALLVEKLQFGYSLPLSSASPTHIVDLLGKAQNLHPEFTPLDATTILGERIRKYLS